MSGKPPAEIFGNQFVHAFLDTAAERIANIHMLASDT
jgi:hypothetical protein